MIDSHCHLADRKFTRDLDAVLRRAAERGVTAMVTIADDIAEAKKCVELAEKYDQLFCTVGVHPHCAKAWRPARCKRALDGRDRQDSLRELRTFSGSSDKVKAIGEIGLDYHYDHSPRDVQQEVFKIQLELAKELHLPAVVHCREAPNQSMQCTAHTRDAVASRCVSGSGRAIDDICHILEEVGYFRLVIHCCTERWEDVRDLVSKRGVLLGFTGIATYPHAGHIRETIRNCPMGQLLVETDAPYLAPQLLRGQRCEPAHVAEVVKLVAEVKGMSLEEVDRRTTANAVAFFALPF